MFPNMSTAQEQMLNTVGERTGMQNIVQYSTERRLRTLTEKRDRSMETESW